MLTPDTSTYAAAASFAAALLLLGVSEIWLLSKCSLSYRHFGYTTLRNSDDSHDDSDGEATKESLRASADLPQRAALLLVSGALLTLALVHTFSPVSLFGSTASVLQYLCLAGWAGVALHAIPIACSSSPSLRFYLGLHSAVATFLILLGALLDVVPSLARVQLDATGTTILIVQVVLGIANFLIALSFHREPSTYHAGRLVDEQFNTTFLYRLTFAWAYRLISLAHSKSKLDATDLPYLLRKWHSENLKARFDSHAQRGRELLVLTLLKEHWRTLALQTCLCAVEAVSMFGPQFAMFRLLSALEVRHTPDAVSQLETWTWVLVLGVSSVFSLTLQEWIEWIKWAIVELQVHAQLEAVVFAKAMRLDDIKEIPGPSAEGKHGKDGGDNDAAQENDVTENSPLLGRSRGKYDVEAHSPDDITSNDGSDDDSEDGEARGVLNLMEVDTQRISVNVAELSEMVSSVIQIFVGLGFLASILGWPSTLAGAAIPILFFPLNRYAASAYTKAQERTSRARDRKTNIINEAVHGMRQIKFSAIELQWQQTIMAARNHELGFLWALFLCDITIGLLWLSMPILLGATALTVYSFTRGNLSPSVAFTALAVFSSLEMAMGFVPVIITDLADTYVSLKRIQDFLDRPEKIGYLQDGDVVALDGASLSWPSREEDGNGFSLRDLSLEFPSGGLSVIFGKTGAGKSLLLAGIVGEAKLTAGRVTSPAAPPSQLLWDTSTLTARDWIIDSAKAYVSQIPWIENASIRDNILYGLPLHRERYRGVLHACALEQDLTSLHDGDDTEVGASGVNLSGGQKWRLTLARALYSRAGILVLDDIFSAVDSQVGRHILETALLGELGEHRTIILATHHIGLVEPVAQYVVELVGEDSVRHTSYKDRPRPATKPLNHLLVPDDTPKSEAGGPRTPRKFVTEEERAEGQVSKAVVKAYADASGGWSFWALTLLTFLLAGMSSLARAYWIKIWTESNSELEASSNAGPTSSNKRLPMFVGVYAALSALSTLLVAVKFTTLRTGALRASRQLFELLTSSVLRAQLRWIDTVPGGRVLNRFIGDFASIDSSLDHFLAVFLDSGFMLLTTVLSALIVSPVSLIIIVPLFLGCAFVARVYLRAARDLKRIESVSGSPVLDIVGTSLSGLATIRTFDKANIYMCKMFGLLDAQSRAGYHLHLLDTWMNYRQGFLGCLFEICIAVFVTLDGSINSAMAGFVLSFALEFSEHVVVTINYYSRLEMDMNAVERVVEYTNIPQEPQDGEPVPTTWPSEGRVVFDNLKVTYAADLPPALKGVSFTIEPHERLGIVGRTGSGKSSLTLSLFRFLEALDGTIHIDGVDISTIKLHDLRSRLSIIPQDPVLFTGTLRSNLDPLTKHSDATLLAALERVNLLSPPSPPQPQPFNPDTTAPKPIFADLSHPISRSGLNLSQGQRQLVCLARAMLGAPRVMVLDEATSAVDMATDALIQRSIREGFADSTLVVVAHRLSTVVDFDRVLVMRDGEVLEHGRPLELWRRGAAFAEMVRESGERDALVGVMEAQAESSKKSVLG